ncbi:GLE1 domain-containing protein (plasmid) [Rhizobium phaseoli]|uniref:Copper chaperone PCu(A)C n=1 Tax=Rhizobium phaseoli TaxID=396 RepID=A0A7X6F781_9HYPH|nr:MULTISPECIES: copper uptake system-associated protein [Rhizobium]ANL38298.1 GLE1 domain-containing protein [Rhizobium phaseoli]ANL69916.1 GLE1 domain-containing protein [Rhizobium phaseoli]ANL76353.1 GLE1 domain-containing protein [Rhizobium phaseoli]ANL82708.1 GLE1 domain-containing protein [Rhizobium phaseoli]ANM02002.1 GLE1 domain-containing protein [Rhizobium phaseoli]
MRKLVQSAVVLGLLTLSAVAVAAHEFKIGDLEIEHPYSKAMIPGAKVAGGYMKITNHGASPDRLVSASTSFAGETQIHEMKVENDIMTMNEIAGGLEIPPGQTVKLKPGGLHVMFMDVAKASKEGDTIKATLTFERAGTVEVGFIVGPANGMPDEHPEDQAPAASTDMLQPDNPQVAIPAVMKGIFETPEKKLTVNPVVVHGDFAIAGWVQDGRGGRALLKKGHTGWAIHLCSGDSLKDGANLTKVGMPEADATALAGKLATAESSIDPETLKLFASFEGTVMMGADAHNDHDGHYQ